MSIDRCEIGGGKRGGEGVSSISGGNRSTLRTLNVSGDRH